MTEVLRSVERFLRKLVINATIGTIIAVPRLRAVLFPLLKKPEGRLGVIVARYLLPVANERAMRRVVEAAQLRPHDRVLELGFASGPMMDKILEAGVSPPVYGLEVVPDMVAITRQRLGSRAVLGLRDIQEVLVGTVSDSLCRDFFDGDDCVRAGVGTERLGEFDKILFTNVYYFFTDDGIKEAASNMFKLLKSGGVAITSHIPSSRSKRLKDSLGFPGNTDPERYFNALREAGFQITRSDISETDIGISIATKE
jgi:hypothetical protein